ncbi:chitinase [Cylindrospermum stagnale PCC 7417]|uniref:chitinase n=1 Tax=Cylindrospermum stagnale PCC 7417 TaxID=56107 RepID=K9WT43_9NOST|nr:glycosyl hydrolase family 18 protein [Cylindrospermum stagnale]AFZ23388.1 chitinase [Cylindrospermum stagnale PCC 7417]
MAYKIVGYYENWAQYSRGFFPRDIDPSLFTHINFAFGFFGFRSRSLTNPQPPYLTGNYKIEPVEWNDQTQLYPELQALKQSNPELKTLLSIGGWSFNDPANADIGAISLHLFSEMVSSSDKRQEFISSAIDYAHQYGFDGIDLDWEYPGDLTRGGTEEDFANFVTLLQEFRQAINSDSRQPKLLLTIAAAAIVPSGVSAQWHSNPQSYFEWLAECTNHLDWVNIMAYDYHGAFDVPAITAVQAPLRQDSNPDTNFSVKNTVENYLNGGVPSEKIVLGLPTYGRTFHVTVPLTQSDNGPGKPFNGGGTAGPKTQESGFLAYFEIKDNISSGSLIREWHEPTLTPYAYNSSTGDWVSYDDEESIEHKTNYLIEKDLAGAMIWAIGLDDFRNSEYPLIRKCKEILGNSKAFTITSGTGRKLEPAGTSQRNR